ncbi:MAG: hypothetical protein AB8C84_00810 [Oligoflexales bacterium]
MRLLRLQIKTLSIVSCLQMSACMTPYQEDGVWDRWSESGAEEVEQVDASESADLAEDIRRLSKLDKQLSEDEWTYLQEQVEDYGVGPEKDALQVLVAVRRALSDEHVANSNDLESVASLEDIVAESALDLPSVLKSNPYLMSSDFYSLALRAVERSGNSHEFREKSLESIRHRARSWMSLGRALGMADEVSQDTAAIGAQDKQPALQQISIEDIDHGNLAFEQAQKVAESGQYQEAIRMLENLAQSSPGHKVMAQAKIRDICNRAVQELRQQAATAFQNAVPMSNEQARTRYLKSAQEHLQQALTLYPEAENLETVRENLAVINSTLERMTGDSGA